MTPTTRDMEEADRLLEELTQMVDYDPDEQAVCWDGQARRTIAQALAARTEQAVKDATAAACAVAAHRSAVPEGHVRLSDGRVCKVPMTADECVAIPMLSVVYHPDWPGEGLDVDVSSDEVVGEYPESLPDGGCMWHSYPISECYGSPEAALAAKEKA